MREIKFRTWDKNKEIMVYDYDQSVGKIYNLSIGSNINNMVYNLGVLYETLMQYTGLKDKNGTEIYEGDIVKFTGVWLDDGYLDKSIQGTSKVIYKKSSFYINDEHLNSITDSEIIGNIYENPELLNEGV